MKICPKCNMQNADDVKFCVYCGTKMEDKIICPHCGSVNDVSSKFCTSCGAKLDGIKTVQQPINPTSANVQPTNTAPTQQSQTSSAPSVSEMSRARNGGSSSDGNGKGLIVLLATLVIGILGYAVYSISNSSKSSTNENDSIVTASDNSNDDVDSDNATTDEMANSDEMAAESEEKSIAKIKDFFNQYCNIFESDDADGYNSLFSSYLTRNYASDFVKNAGYNWRGERVYCDQCGDYEKADPLHFEHPHEVPSTLSDIKIKSVVKEDTGKYVVLTEGTEAASGGVYDFEKYRISVVEQDGDYLFSKIERFDDNTNRYYDLAIIKN